jgi:hypothetical protein
MKKHYALITSFFALSYLAAQTVNKAETSSVLAPAAAQYNNVFTDLSPTGNSSSRVARRGVNYTSFIRLGSTWYDLQTNYAMPHRLLVHPNGSVSATWTTSPNDANGFPSRGSGYNFRTPEGKWLKSDSTGVEVSTRTGWPNIGKLRNGTEFIIAHDATTGGFAMTKNSAMGTRPSTVTKILQETPYKPIWARVANDGDTIHLIHSYSDSAAAGEKRAPTRKGIFAPMAYCRSINGGTDWDIKHIMLPDYDSTLTNNGGADQYSIDAKGKTVAIVNADKFQGVILWKSEDAGATFKRIIVDTFKYAPYSAKKLMLDTPFTNDGTCDVIIDGNGKVHVFWGVARVGDDDTTNETFLDFFGTMGIGHWSEQIGTSRFIAGSSVFDRDGDGGVSLQAATYRGLESVNGVTSLPTVNGSKLSTCSRLGQTNPMRQPSAAIDDNGNIYCIFSIPIEGDVSLLGANFRDIGVVYSKDSGKTWGTAQNLTQVLTREDDFACVARRANGFLHMMWQQDIEPGTNLQNNSPSDGNHLPTLNEILYQAIPLGDILDEKIGMVWGLKVDKPNTGKAMIVGQNYPNPFSGSTSVIIWLTNPGDVKVDVRNSAGALVRSETHSGLNRGNHILNISAEGLSAGVYTYSITSGGSTAARTMMVK